MQISNLQYFVAQHRQYVKVSWQFELDQALAAGIWVISGVTETVRAHLRATISIPNTPRDFRISPSAMSLTNKHTTLYLQK